MRIIAKKILREFWKSHPDTEQVFKSWYTDVKVARWTKPADIKKEYAAASILKDNRVVFNIKGNQYRIVVKINYDYEIVYIRFVGTHAEYDKINADEI